MSLFLLLHNVNCSGLRESAKCLNCKLYIGFKSDKFLQVTPLYLKRVVQSSYFNSKSDIISHLMYSFHPRYIRCALFVCE